MTDLLTRLDVKFHNRVQLMQQSLAHLKERTIDGITELEDDFFDYIERVEETLTERREKFDAAEGVLDIWIAEKRESLKTWLDGREAEKLQEEAQKAQHYAEAAMEVAVGAMDKAEIALARALMAKSYANAAKIKA